MHMMGPGKRLRIYIGESDHWQGKTLYMALLETLKGALLVPQRAVTDMQGRSLVAVVGSDNKVSIRPVEAGEQVGLNWVVKGNLKAGDRVVAEGVQKVREGAVVNPVPFTEKTAAAAPATPAAKAEEKKD